MLYNSEAGQKWAAQGASQPGQSSAAQAPRLSSAAQTPRLARASRIPIHVTNPSLHEVEGETQPHGLVIYRASRLEALLEPLAALLEATSPADALAPQTLIAAHPGIAQWLSGALARRYGSTGIAANLDILLPSEWIERLAQRRLGQRAVALPAYARPRLRWVIHDALSDDPKRFGIVDTRVAHYLRQGEGEASAAEAAQRRFQLADRLASLYSRYLVYRPDWLLAWERGEHPTTTSLATAGPATEALRATERDLLCPLWRHLRNRLGAHRGSLVEQLIAVLRSSDEPEDDGAIHAFGLAHLAPSELAVLRAYAQRRLVALYVPDPCREFWGGLSRSRELSALLKAREAEEAHLETAPEGDYWTQRDHPLLAAWGRLGQHFMLALAEGEVLEDVRHWRDERPEPPRNRLARVQQSIRELDVELLRAPLNESTAETERRDASLRIHACHTQLRELEVLRDQLLDALSDSNTAMKPSDIVVMAPDIQAYAPLIPTVFGVPGDALQALPYHLADIPIARSHSLFTAFRRLLELPASRLTLPEIIDLLSLPEVARRFDLSASSIEGITDWLQRSRAAWALDADFRKRFGAPPIAEHTLGWAMDRMLAGYLLASDSDERAAALVLPDGCELSPLPGIHGPSAQALGALDELLEQVQALCDLRNSTLPASVWARELERCCEAMFRIDTTDAAARDAQEALLRTLRSLATEPGEAGLDPPLHFSVVRDLLAERLDAVPEHQRFLMGGITFCGMVPQRAIPFRMVAVLGLNDGQFPRVGSDSGLDPMARQRRIGDRDVRSDDRYLFLETVMSARQRLHLSYLGEGVRDGKPRNPAAPLAELLAVLDQAAGLAPDDAQTDRPWRVRHPLQAFDARYFDGSDVRLFSFDSKLSGMAQERKREVPEAFFDPSRIKEPAAPSPQDIALDEVRRYYKDPARTVLERRMQLRLDALDDSRLAQTEPLEARLDALDQVTQRLFFAALPDGIVPDEPPAWLRLGGVLPPGKPGERVWEQEREKVQLLLNAARALHGELGSNPPSSHDIDLHIAGQRLIGRVENVWQMRDSEREHWLLLRPFATPSGLKPEHAIGFRERVPMFLDWASVRVASSHLSPLPAVRLCALFDADAAHFWQRGIQAWDARFVGADAEERTAMRVDLEQRVARLIQWFDAAHATSHWYFAKAAWETLRPWAYGKTLDSAMAAPGSNWIATSENTIGERDYGPGYNRLLAGDVGFEEGTPELAALQKFARELHACLCLGAQRHIEAAP